MAMANPNFLAAVAVEGIHNNIGGQIVAAEDAGDQIIAAEVAGDQIAVVPQILPHHSGLGANRFGPPYVCYSTHSDHTKCMKTIHKYNGFKKHVDQRHRQNPFGCRCLSKFRSAGELEDHRQADNC